MVRKASWLRHFFGARSQPVRKRQPGQRLQLELLPDRILPSADPVLTLIGSAQAVEGSAYALTLGPVVDADANHVITQYVIHWGDNSTSTYTPATLPANRTITHTYADGVDAAAVISVDLYEQAGTFYDTAFGGGPFRSHLGGNDQGYDVAGDPTTGDVVVLGSAAGVTSFIRYKADGTLDTTFGSNGVVPYDGAVNLSSGTHAFAIDSAGHFLVGGQFSGDWAVARYNADGSRDAAFGTNGVTSFYLSSQPKTMYALAVDAQDRIYMTGETFNPATNSWDVQMARLTANGQLDPTFSITPTHIGSPNRGTAISVDRNTGNVYVVDSTNLGTLILRFTPTGTLDTSFGSNGTAWITSPYPFPDYEMVVDSAGRVLIGGAVSVNGRYQFAVARYTTSGALDTAFGTNGVQSVNLGGFTEVVRGLALDAEGRVLLVGYATPATNGTTDIELARLLENGDGPYLNLVSKTITVANAAPTVTLTGTSGPVLQGDSVSFQGSFTDPGAAADGAYSYTWSVTSSNGQTVAPVSGTLAAPGAVPNFGFTLTAGGTYTIQLTVVDKDGGSTTQQVVLNGIGLTLTGAATVDEGTAYALTLGPVVDADPQHVVSKYIVHWGDGTQSTYAAASLPADRTVFHTYTDGSAATVATQITVDLVESALVLDTGFGTGGTVIKDFGGLDSAYSVATDPTTGKLIVLGSVNGSLSFARYRANGTLDTSFGTGGVVPYVSVMGTYGYALAIDSAGRIYVGGMTNTPATGSDFAVARYLASGSLDTSFGVNGIATVALGSSVESVFDLALDAQGRILLVGQTQASVNLQAMVLMRLTPAGALDPTFTTTVQNVNGYNLSRAVAVDPATGNILVLASAGTQYSLFRFLPDGARDTSFGANGRRTLPGITGNGLAIDANGRILVGIANGSDFAVARYQADGTADTTFGNNGTFTVNLGGGSEDANNLALDGHGRLVLAGYSAGTNANQALVRALEIDAGPYLAVAAKTIAINNVAPTATITGGPTTSNEGSGVIFQGSFADPGLTADATYQYTWTVTASNGQTVTPQTGTVAAPGVVPAFSFTPADNGSYAVQLVITEKDGASSLAAERILVVSNIAPTATITSGPTASNEGDAVTFAGSFTDPGANDAPFQYAWTVSASNGQTVAGLTGSGPVTDYSFTPADNGTYTVRLVVTDKDGAASNTAERILTVSSVAPTAQITSGPTASNEGDAVTFNGGFSDPGPNDAPFQYAWTVSASNGQTVAGLTGNGPVAAYSFTPADNGTYTVRLVVTDKDGSASNTAERILTVSNVAPTAQIISGPTASNEGEAVTFAGSFTDPGLARDAAYGYTWTVTASNGQAVASLGGTVAQTGAVPDFTFTPADNGTYTISFVVTDKDGAASATAQRTLTVSNLAPTATITSGPTAGNEGDAVTFAGSFTDAGANDAPFQYAWTVSASNGQTIAGLAGTGPVADYSFTPADNGTYSVRLIVTDKDGAASMAADRILVVSNVAPTASVTGPTTGDEGNAVTFTGSFTDPGLTNDGPYQYAWSVVASNGRSVAGLNGSGTVADYTFTPIDNGTYTVRLIVTDKDGAASAVAESVLTVANIAPTATITGGPLASDEGDAVTFTGNFTDPGGNDSPFQYAWTVSASNGQIIAGLTGSGPVADYSFTPADNGTYTMCLIVADKDGAASVAAERILLVSNVAPTAQITSGPATSNEGDAVTFTGSFSDPGLALDGAYAYAWTVTASNGQAITPLNGTVVQPGAVPAFTFTAADNGTYTITLVVADKDGATSAAAQRTLTVNNVAPTATITSGPTASNEGDAVTFSGSFSDPGLTDDSPYQYAWTVTASNGQAVAGGSGVGAVADYAFTPADNGTYTVQLVVTDKDGAASLAAERILVVSNVAPTATITSGPNVSDEGDSVTFAGSFADPGANDSPFQYAWTVLASNGQSVAGLSGSGAVADYTFTPADNGTYTVRLVVTDKDGAASVGAECILIVSNVPPTVAVTGPASSVEGDGVTFAGSFSDPGLLADGLYQYAWSVVASNGQVIAPMQSTLGMPGNVGDFHFTPADDGTYTITLVVTDKDGAARVMEQTLLVHNAPPTALIGVAATEWLEGSAVTLTGGFTDPGLTNDGDYHYAWSVTASNGQNVATALGTTSMPGAVAAYQFMPWDNGSYIVRLVVTDKDGAASVAAEQVLTVGNVPPTAALFGGAALGLAGGSSAFQGGFTDPGQLHDAVYTYTWYVSSNNGQAATAYAATQGGPGLIPCFFFTPAASGRYTIRLVVTDKDGGTSTAAETTLTVPSLPVLAEARTSAAPAAVIAGGQLMASNAPVARGLPSVRSASADGTAGSEGMSLIAGRVFLAHEDADAMTPAVGVRVLLEREGLGTFTAVGSTVTAADGSFTFAGMMPDTYRVRLADVGARLTIRDVRAHRVHCLPTTTSQKAAHQNAPPIADLAEFDRAFLDLDTTATAAGRLEPLAALPDDGWWMPAMPHDLDGMSATGLAAWMMAQALARRVERPRTALRS